MLKTQCICLQLQWPYALVVNGADFVSNKSRCTLPLLCSAVAPLGCVQLCFATLRCTAQ